MKIRRIIEDYEAKLLPAGPARAGARLKGKAEWEKFASGDEEFEVRVRNVDLPDGTSLDVLLSGGLIGRIELEGNYGELLLESRNGVGVPRVHGGDKIAVTHQGSPLLEGTFIPD